MLCLLLPGSSCLNELLSQRSRSLMQHYAHQRRQRALVELGAGDNGTESPSGDHSEVPYTVHLPEGIILVGRDDV